jgi:hypothetical protein
VFCAPYGRIIRKTGLELSQGVKRKLNWSKKSQLGADIHSGLETGSRGIAIVRSRYLETSIEDTAG